MANGGNVILGQLNFATQRTGVWTTGNSYALDVVSDKYGLITFVRDSGYAVVGSARGNGLGVYGEWVPDREGATGAGVQGTAQGGRHPVREAAGVVGDGLARGAVGVRGFSFDNAGVDGQAASGSGVAGTSFRGTGVYGYSRSGPGIWGVTGNSNSYAGGFWGNVFVAGDFFVGGAKSAAVPHPDGSHRCMYAMECPESWFEDFGSGKLVRGKARIRLDRDFAALVRAGDYHVFLSATGDSNGLYVSRKARTGFEVREQRGGRSSLRFSYRVVARRRDIAGPRLAKVKLPSRPPTPRAPKPSAVPKLPKRSRRERSPR